MSKEDWSHDNSLEDGREQAISKQAVIEDFQIKSSKMNETIKPPVEEKEIVPEPKLATAKSEVVVTDGREAKPSMKDLILLGIDNGLDMFGKNVKEIFYAEVESSAKIKRALILDNVEQFDAMIEKFFGPGAPLVKRSIGRAIMSVFELPSEAGFSLKTSLEIVKRHPRIDIK